jgi:hypothetical protein
LSNFGFKGFLLSLVLGGNTFVAVQMWYPLRERIGSEFIHARKKLWSIYDSYALFGTDGEGEGLGVPCPAPAAPDGGDAIDDEKRSLWNIFLSAKAEQFFLRFLLKNEPADIYGKELTEETRDNTEK